MSTSQICYGQLKNKERQNNNMALTIEDIITQKEGQTFDCKSVQIEPKVLAVPIVSMANADGGTLAIEGAGASGKAYKNWSGGINIGNSPEYGSIVIFKTGHVGFVIGTTNEGKIDVIHGNWSDRIQRNDNIKMSEIDCFVRPIKQ